VTITRGRHQLGNWVSSFGRKHIDEPSIPTLKDIAKHPKKQSVANEDKSYLKQVRQDMFGLNG
jgi:hypothetical protein